MNYKQLLLLCIIILLGTTNSMACMCEENIDFYSTYDNYSDVTKRKAVILQGVKIANDGHGMKIERIATLLGRENRDTITVWGDNGFLCRVNTGFFEIGDTLILNISRMDEGFLEEESTNDYELSRCGWHYLRMKEGMIAGHINDSEIEMSMSDFEDLLEQLIISTDVEEWAKPDLEIQVFPNPTTEKVTIKSEYNEETTIHIYNALGQNVFENNLKFTSDVLTINVGDWTKGIYYIRIKRGDSQLVEPLFVL